MSGDVVVSVSEFVALVNQTLEYAYGSVVITGELANLKVSKNKWVYFDLKDEQASVRFFGTVYMLPGPLEDGMMLEVRGNPRLHPQFGFSVTVQSIRPVGEGSIKKAAALLEQKLATEGLFDVERKRSLPYPPERIALVTSRESAAYADFIKILDARWRGLSIDFADVQVQGEQAPEQIVSAIQQLNQMAEPPEVLVLIRGGGSADDLQAFSAEPVVRAVASSRVPTLVAVGHEIDTSLAELAADQRASTPSNAAELLVPDRREVAARMGTISSQLNTYATERFATARQNVQNIRDELLQSVGRLLERQQQQALSSRQLLAALNPSLPLERGYAIVRTTNGKILRSSQKIVADDIVQVEMKDATFDARVQDIWRK